MLELSSVLVLGSSCEVEAFLVQQGCSREIPQLGSLTVGVLVFVWDLVSSSTHVLQHPFVKLRHPEHLKRRAWQLQNLYCRTRGTRQLTLCWCLEVQPWRSCNSAGRCGALLRELC